MNDVCETWSSPWVELQKALARAPAPAFRVQSGSRGAGTWLERASNRLEDKPTERRSGIRG
jgi:hypothetical protein